MNTPNTSIREEQELTPKHAPRSSGSPRKKCFAAPALILHGTVPRITCGSDIFGDQ